MISLIRLSIEDGKVVRHEDWYALNSQILWYFFQLSKCFNFEFGMHFVLLQKCLENGIWIA